MRIGFGYDVHQFSPGRQLWLGGIEVPYEQGLLGHSDADVVIHALCDALLGAAAMRDIGYHFPDTKGNEFEGIDSKILLHRVMAMIREAMGVATNQVSLKATTTEHLGFVGRQEGIAAYAVALIQ